MRLNEIKMSASRIYLAALYVSVKCFFIVSFIRKSIDTMTRSTRRTRVSVLTSLHSVMGLVNTLWMR